MYNQNDFDGFKKMTLRRLRPILKSLSIERDFIELSTHYMGKNYEVRVMGVKTSKDEYSWDLVRVINQSIIPSEAVTLAAGVNR